MHRIGILVLALVFLMSNLAFAAGSFGGSKSSSSKPSVSTSKPSAPALTKQAPPSSSSSSGSFGGSKSTPSKPSTSTADKSASGSFGGPKPTPVQPTQPSQPSTTDVYHAPSNSGSGLSIGSFAGGLFLGSMLNRGSAPVQNGYAQPVQSSPSLIGSFFMLILTLIQLALIAVICYWLYKFINKWWAKRKAEKGSDAYKFKW